MTDYENIAYLVRHDVPLLVDKIVENLMQNKPVTPLKWLQTEVQRQESQRSEIKVVFVLGGPGSGKGTQCEKIVKRFGCGHLSAGDLLRAEVKSGSQQGRMLDDLMKQGKLVPGSVTISLLKKAIESLPSTCKWVLVDGFPREMKQCLDFERTVAIPTFVLSFDVPDELLVRRLLGRAASSGRADDNEATIMKRLHTFHTQSQPVIDYYRARNILNEIQATSSPDEVWKEVMPLFILPSELPKVVYVLGGPGSGKGTMCERLVQRYQCGHLSAGDLLRAEVKSGSPQGKQLDQWMKEGKIVPGQITIGLLRKALSQLPTSMPFVLIDGFPREMSQAVQFENSVTPCRLAITFNVPDDVMIRRLTERAKTSGRADDNLETIKKRLVTFHAQSEPVLEYLKALEKLKEIDATRTVDEVWKLVQPIFSQL